MNLSGKHLIPAARSVVWEGLNNPDFLRQSIPGCQVMEKQAEDSFTVIVAIKVGPIGARLNGAVTIADLNPMNSYSLICDGDGGAAGAVKSVIKVTLEDEGDSTNLSYEVEAQINGKLAQLGGAVVEATAKRLAGLFFKKFSEVLLASTEPAVADSADDQGVQTGTAEKSVLQPARKQCNTTAAQSSTAGFPLGWVVALLIAEVVGYIAGSTGSAVEPFGWFGLSLVLLVALATTVAYGLGRRAASSVVVMDQVLLDKLNASQSEEPS